MATKAQSISFLLSQVRASGVALAGGEVDFFAVGTSTRKTIWLDRNKSVEAANPYTLDANGTAQLFADGVYRVVIRDSSGVEKYDRDGLSFRDASSLAYDVADYASLAAAVAAIGSTPATLQFASDLTISANLVIPSTLELMPLNGSKINHTSYTISYSGSTARWPLAQVFNGTGTVSLPNALGGAAPEWFAPNTTPGTTDMSDAVQSAFNSNPHIRITGNYSVGVITVPVTCRKIYGGGTFTQKAAGAHILSATSNTGPLLIDSILFVGVAGTVFTSTDTAIRLITCTNATVINCLFTGLRGHAVHSVNSEHVKVYNNRVSSICGGLRFTGGQYIWVHKNLVGFTSSTAFTIAICFDSINVEESNSYCRFFSVQHNIIRGYVDAQGILFHSGIKGVIAHNIIENALISIDLGMFDATGDLIEDISIHDNVCTGYALSLANPGVEGAYAVSVSGKSGKYAERVKIHDNISYTANRSGGTGGTGFANSSAFNIAYVNNSQVYNNTAVDPGFAGVSIGNPCSNSAIYKNKVRNVVDIGDGVRHGYFIAGALSYCELTDNEVYGAEIGIRDSSTGSVGSFTGRTIIASVTTDTSTVNVSVILEGFKASTAETTPSVFRASTLNVLNSAPVTITDFLGGREGQEFTAIFDDANTTIANGTSLRTGTGGNVTPGAKSSRRFKRAAGVWYMQ